MTEIGAGLDLLQHKVHDLKLEFNRFLSGALEAPPDDLLASARADIRRLHETARSTADRFRLNNLEASLNSYSERFNRQLQEMEHQGRRGQAAPAGAEGEECRHIVGDHLGREVAESLYKGLYDASKRADKVDFETFMSYLDNQRAQIRERTGCSSVQFRVASEDGKRKLKAKPAADRETVSSRQG